MKKLFASAILVFLMIGQSSYAMGWSCSAFFINPDGYLVTAGHCVHGAKHLTVIQGKELREAKLIIADYVNDVAIIKVEGKSPDFFYSALEPNLDNTIYILGYPIPDFRGYNLKAKSGSVNRSGKTFYTISGGSCQGNSGGPVVNSSNNVIGVLTAGYGSIPCAYYGLAQKIQNVIVIAKIMGVDIPLSNTPNPTLINSHEAVDVNTNKVPLLLGDDGK